MSRLGPAWVQGAQCKWPCNVVVVFCYSSACYFSMIRWFDVIFFFFGFCHFLKLPWGNFQIGSKRHCCLSLPSKSLVHVLCEEVMSYLLYSSRVLISFLFFMSTLGSSIICVTTRVEVVSRESTSRIHLIFLQKLCQTYCRDWHSAKKCCLVSGPESQSLQAGSKANWLKTAQLLWWWATNT